MYKRIPQLLLLVIFLTAASAIGGSWTDIVARMIGNFVKYRRTVDARLTHT